MKSSKIWMISLVVMMVTGPAMAGESLPFKLSSRPVQGEIQRFHGEGKDHLAYELILENFHATPLRFDSLRIQLIRDGKEVYSNDLRGKDLAQSFSMVQENYHKPQDPVLPPGSAAVFFLWIDVPTKATAFDSVQTQFNVEELGRPETRMTLDGPRVAVSARPAREIVSPLRGTSWWTPNGPANDSIHRRILIPMSGNLWAPERYAVDWIKLGDDGKNYAGDPKSNASYHAYGQEILSVAAGKVVALKDGIPENIPNSKEMAVPIDLETIGGNYVIVDIGEGRFAFYAHLQPGKIRVKLGDDVAVGQVLGLLGNSGNSTEPHLHFHIIDRPDPLRGQGQPFALNHFTRILGRVELDANDDPVGIVAKGREKIKGESYMNLELADFEEGR